MGSADEWAGGPNDKERKRNKLSDAVDWFDFAVFDSTPDFTRTRLDEIDESARVWKSVARRHGLEFYDPRSDGEAQAANAAWGPLLARLRGLGLPVQRVRALVRGQDQGVHFQSACVCDADDGGNVIPLRLWALPARHRLPDAVGESGFGQAPLPMFAKWGTGLAALPAAVATADAEDAIQGGRLSRNRLGRAILGKVNEFLSGDRWAEVRSADARFARAAADWFAADRTRVRSDICWIMHGEYFVYVTKAIGNGMPASGENHLLKGANELQDELARAVAG